MDERITMILMERRVLIFILWSNSKIDGSNGLALCSALQFTAGWRTATVLAVEQSRCARETQESNACILLLRCVPPQALPSEAPRSPG